MASSAANGSSISSSWLSWASARAIATRCRIPPDSSCTRLPYAPSSRTSSSSRSASVAALGAAARRAAAARVRCSCPRSATGRGRAPGTSGPAGRRASSMLPGGRPVEARDQVEQRGLAAARGPQEARRTRPGATSSVMSSRTSCCRAGPAEGLRDVVDPGGVRRTAVPSAPSAWLPWRERRWPWSSPPGRLGAVRAGAVT